MRKRFALLYKQRYLHLMVLPIILWLLLFKYLPIAGMQIAFRKYRIVDGIWGSPWVGLQYFQEFFKDPKIWPAIQNTLGISGLKLLFQFPLPILFALMLNELRSIRLKRVLQTVSYFPHFLSYSIVALIVSNWLSTTSQGLINNILVGLGILRQPKLFLGDPKAFWWIILGIEIWKTLGWDSIIYLAAIAGISPDLYEAADIDGASRLRKIVSITFPSIRPTVMLLLIMRIGSIMGGANFDLCYLLNNRLNNAASEILDTYVMRIGISSGRFSYGAAVGLLLAVVSMVLVVLANWTSNRMTGEGLF